MQSDRRRPRTILVLPAFNEAGKIGRVVRGARRDLLDKVVVVDDGSTDTTAQEAGEAGATVLSHDRNRGVGAALRTGFHHARDHGFEVIVVMGGDDQDRHEEMDNILGPIFEDRFDFVQGSRRLQGLRTVAMPLFRRVTTWLYTMLFRILTGFPCTDGSNGYRAFRSRILDDPAIRLDQEWLDRYELEPYLFTQAIRRGYRVVEAPVTKVYHASDVGYTKMVPILDWWRLVRPLVFLRLRLRK